MLLAEGTGAERDANAQQDDQQQQQQQQQQASADSGLTYWERLVGTPSGLHGRLHKQAVLPAHMWDPARFNFSAFEDWLRTHDMPPPASGLTDAAAPPDDDDSWRPATGAPAANICAAYVNHRYRLLFVRTRKAASTSIREMLADALAKAGACRPRTPRRLEGAAAEAAASASGAHSGNATEPGDLTAGPRKQQAEGRSVPPIYTVNACLPRLDPQEVRQRGLDPEAMWRDYTVVSSNRNPWARAASAHAFLWKRWKRHTGECAQPSFLQFARDPYVMGKVGALFGCGLVSPDPTLQRFDHGHVEPAGHCMRGPRGGMVADFLIRYEHLQADTEAAIQLINERRPKGMPPLEAREMTWRLKSMATHKADNPAYAYADKMRSCGWPCVSALWHFHQMDMQLYGWGSPDRPPADDRGGTPAGGGRQRQRQQEEERQEVARY